MPTTEESGGLRPPLAGTHVRPPEHQRSQIRAICDRWSSAAALSGRQTADFLAEIERVLEAAKLESLAEFAAGAGHEINNPVATIAGRAQLLLSGESDPERRHALEIIGGQALRIRDMIGDVMLFARPPAPRFERLELLAAARQAVESQAELFAQRGAKCTLDVPPQFELWADRTQTLVLLSSLIRNSLEAADRPGITISITIRRELQADQNWSVLTMSDDGPGIPDAVREHLFDPFYSARQAGRGLGFGLSKCWRIAQLHGGWIEVAASVGRGAKFEVWWPRGALP